MGNRTGIANLPLHYGKAPAWLFQRMKELAREITIVIITEFGPEEMLKRLSNPFWFQAFGCILGFDWHSSGLTTTVTGALKEGLKSIQKDLGFFVAGGKGRTSRQTPQEIEKASLAIAADPRALVYASRIAAKVDTGALQDGYQLYHHTFFFTKDGKWAVVQQGMNETNRYARRYHWLSAELKDFVVEPHKAICSDQSGLTLNLVARESEPARQVTTEVSREKPEKIVRDLKRLTEVKLPRYHQVLLQDINPERLKGIFLSTYEQQPENFERLLALPGVGPKTIRALSLISELVYGASSSFRDPVRYSFAHGGKDSHPYPVDKANYDKSIHILRTAISHAKLGKSEKFEALRRLSKVTS